MGGTATSVALEGYAPDDGARADVRCPSPNRKPVSPLSVTLISDSRRMKRIVSRPRFRTLKVYFGALVTPDVRKSDPAPSLTYTKRRPTRSETEFGARPPTIPNRNLIMTATSIASARMPADGYEQARRGASN